MRLGDLFEDAVVPAELSDRDVTRVEIDSRRCEPGVVFFAMPGTQSHGSQFVTDALSRGASAVVGATAYTDETIVVATELLRGELRRVSSLLTGSPEERCTLVGVTGTNGKTSVVTMIAQLVRAMGNRGESLGTLTNARTTPDAPELFRSLASCVGPTSTPENTVISMEVSSHALDQGRVEGVRFAVGVFTNLSHDHLDYHGSMDEYFAAKRSFFSPHYLARAVVWADGPYGQRLINEALVPTTPVSRSEISKVTVSLSGTSFLWRGHTVTSGLVGEYNIDNLLLALHSLLQLGYREDDLVTAAASLTPVPGRFNIVQGASTAVVDFAHTPDGLERLLRDVRALAPSAKIITVFGCGGDRDREKRPLMGEIAARLSDEVIITSDNPRNEAPDAIIDEIWHGVANDTPVERVVDRREAIARAMRSAGVNDVVVVAGKGHEQYQIIGDVEVPFDDVTVTRELMRK